MLNNETAAGLQPAAILAPNVGSSQNTFQVSISDLNYNINSNPYAGPYYLARLLVNLPVEEASLLTLGLPWQTLALGIMNCQGQERVSKFEELIQSTAQGETIRQAVFSSIKEVDMPKKNSPSKPVHSFRLSLECVRQLKDLSGTMGRSGGDVVEVAVDRMYREEIRFGNLMISEGKKPEEIYKVEKKEE